MKIKKLLLTIAAIALIPALSQAKPQGAKEEKGNGNRGGVIEKLDTDGNGSISVNEAKGPLAKHFERIDNDSNGEITKQELAKAGMKIRKRKNKGGDPEKYFMKLDTDGNGGISEEEAGERMAERFDDLDADGSGEITIDELRSAAKQRKEERKKKGQDEEARSI
ncbi:MAG: EF-hand domain-containing protein [Lentimonas sp.]